MTIKALDVKTATSVLGNIPEDDAVATLLNKPGLVCKGAAAAPGAASGNGSGS